MLNYTSRVFLVAAIGLVVWAGWWRLLSSDQIATAGALDIENLERDLGEQQVGVHSIEFRIRNISDRPNRIIGFHNG